MKRRIACAVALTAWLAQAAGIGVPAFLGTVRAAIQARQSDAEIAATVDATLLSERLDDAVIEQLQSEGAGPLTVDSLERLRDVTFMLPARTVRLFDTPPAPSAEEQASVVAKVREVATHYMANLPNFLCTE